MTTPELTPVSAANHYPSITRFLIFSIVAQLAGLLASAAAPVEANFTSASVVPITAASYAAGGNQVNVTLGFAPQTGARLTVVKVTSASLITGEFSNLAHGQKIGLTYNETTYPFIANYYGGTGNDLVLEWAYRSPVAWGGTSFGQIGDGSSLVAAPDRSIPVAVNTSGALAGKTVLAIAAGDYHNLALCSDGTVVAWGLNNEGQLGIDSTTNSNVPVLVTLTGVLSGKRVVAVAAGDDHSLALCSDGTVASWGSNSYGLLGLDYLIERSTVPVEIAKSGALSGKTVVAVSAAIDSSHCLCSDGTVVGWGYNGYGQLGNNSTSSSVVPVAVNTSGVLAGKTVVSLNTSSSLSPSGSSSASHCLALCSNGTIFSWGANSNGKLGDDSTSNRPVPVAVKTSGVLAGKTMIVASAANRHSLALSSDGMIASWGNSTFGQLGNGSTTSSSVPVLVHSSGVLAGKSVVSVAAGGYHSCALCSDGTVATWGYNSSGQLGDGSTASSSVPVAVNTSGVLAGKSVMAIAAAREHVLALAASPLSTNTGLASVTLDADDLVPAYPSGPSDYAASVPSSRTSVTVAPVVADPLASVTVNGVEIPSGTASQPIPLSFGFNIITLLVKAEDRAVTRSYTLSVLRPEPVDLVFDSPNGATLTVPAYNATGNTITMRLNFRPETGARLRLINVTGASFAGKFTNLAHGQKVGLDYDGTTYPFIANYHGGNGNDLVLEWAYRSPVAWGENGSGQLGNNSTTDRSVPVAVNTAGVLAGKTVMAVAGGSSHSVALCSDGTVAVWGANSSGQLGNNSTTNSSVPVLVSQTGVLAGKTAVVIAAGSSHSLALCSDGSVAAWGNNSSGRLGNNSTTNSSVPVLVDQTGALSAKTVVAIAAGSSHSLAVCSDGTVAAWGANTSGQLGNNSTVSSSVPVLVSQTGVLSGKTVVEVAAGSSHSIAVCSDGTLVAWGANSSGQLGNNSTTNSSVPVLISQAGVLSGKTVVEVAAGASHSLAFCADGSVAAWGGNTNGQLGNDTTTTSSIPVLVSQAGVLSGKTVVAVAAGDSNSLALCSDGVTATWGANSSGQLGNNSTTGSSVPVLVDQSGILSGKPLMSASAGGSHVLALAASPLSTNTGFASVTIDGNGLVPAYPSGPADYAASVPAACASATVTPIVADPLASVAVNGVEIASGAASQPIPLVPGINTITLLVKAEDRSVTKTYTLSVLRPEPVDVVFDSPDAAALTVPAYNATGNTITMRLNFRPETGTRLKVINVTGSSFAGEFSNLAHGQKVGLDYDGTTYPFIVNYHGGNGNDLVLEWAYRSPVAWGYNNNGQLGNISTTGSSVPVPVNASGVLAGKTVMAVAGGSSHSVALCSDGTVAAWGANSSGQLGNNSTTNSSVPVLVSQTGVLAGKTAVVIAAGSSHSLALCSDGSVAAWGNNSSGRLGNNSTTNSSVPVLVDQTGVLSAKTVVAIAAGSSHSIVVCSDGTVAAWGANTSGQLGNNSPTGSSVPVLVSQTGVLSGKTVVDVAAGSSHSIAVCSDGTVVAWGANSSGQLGNNSTTNSSVPVLISQAEVLSGETVVEVAAGSSHSLALCADGTVAAWGGNSNGQLGNDTTTTSSVPVLVSQAGVLSGKTVVAVAAGDSNSLALCSDGVTAAWGANTSGQLGNNSTTGSSVPVLVDQSGILSGKPLMSASAGGSHVLAQVAVPISTNTELAAVTVNADSAIAAYPSGPAAYAASVPAARSSITVTPTSADSNAAVAVNGVGLASGTESQPIPLSPGHNSIAILVTAEDRSVTNAYTLSVLRPEPLVADLNSQAAAAVTVPAYNATGNTITMRLNFRPETGAQITVIRVTASALAGEFANLTHGQQVGLEYNGTTYPFIANYHGGNGNDLVLEWAYRSAVAWGSNGSGQLGNGTVIDSSAPLAVSASNALAGRTVMAVSGGGSHSLAVCADGTVAAWGRNDFGQLGNSSSTANSSVPVLVSQTGVLYGKSVVAVEAGSDHSIALCSDGTVAAWGSNSSGRLGNGSTASSSFPVLVSQTGVLSGKTVAAVAAGYNHSLALCSDGTVAAWGSGWIGQLGNNSAYNNSSVPVLVTQTGVLSGKRVVAVAAGYEHSLALCEDGTVAAWGRNSYGQLGNDSTVNSSVPMLVSQTGVLSGRTVVAVAAGDYFSLALCSDGTVAAWGDNSSGQLGNNSTTSSSVPVAVSFQGTLEGKTAVGIHAGNSHSLAVFRDGTMAVWGSNFYGQLGDGSMAMSPVPALFDMSALPDGAKVMSAAAGGSHNLASIALALSQDAGLSAISIAQAPLFPAGSTSRTAYFAAVPTGTASVTVTAAASHPLAAVKVNGVLTPSGTASQAIALSYGENGIEITVAAEDRSFTRTYTITILRPPPLTAMLGSGAAPPVRFPGYDATGNTVQMELAHAPVAGADLTMIDNTGLGFIRGRFVNLAHGQAVTLSYQGRDYQFVADYFGGTGNDLVLHWADRQLAAWGSNAAGQTGLGDVPDAWVPAGVPAAGVLNQKSLTRLAVGDYHSLALGVDGTVAAWGYNLFGQLGNNRTADSLVPVAVLANDALAGKTVAAVAAGAVHSLALCSDGTVAAWGANDSGQLGNNGTTSCRVPVAVTSNGALAGKSVAAIAAGDSHSLALCADGTVVAWGDNYSGQLGKGGTGDEARVPVAMDTTGALAGKVVMEIAAGGFHSLARCSDGTVAAWGYNGYGQLGNGTRTDSPVPVAVDLSALPPGVSVVGISAGQNHTLLLCSDGTVGSCGSNASGQLGDGTKMDRIMPVGIGGGALTGKIVTALSAGERHSLALCSDGTLAAWGANSEGQLGNDTSVPATTPVAVHSFALGFGARITRLPVGATASHVLATSSISPGGADPYTAWLRGFLSAAEMNDPALSGPQADPAHDGIPNLMKYALGLPPLIDGSAETPAPMRSDGYLTLTFRKNKAATDLTYVVEAADRLAPANWSVASTLVSQIDMGDHWLVTIRDNVPVAGNPQRFMRLRVVR